MKSVCLVILLFKVLTIFGIGSAQTSDYHVNECEAGTHNCSEHAICNDIKEGFQCSCMTGYTGDGYTCTDVNECTTDSKCHNDADCLNTLGSYQCSCKPGFTGNGTNCDDIDECATLPHNCDYCYNSHGGFQCDCTDGLFSNNHIYPSILDTDVYNFESYNTYRDFDYCSNLPYNCTGTKYCKCSRHVSNMKTICFQIDECLFGQNSCYENATCLPARNRSYTCQCNHGFTGNGFNCTDVDECKSFQPPCTNCTNTIGGYSCGCLNGYDGDQCTDIDECAEGTHNCHPRATCTNTDGSYNCTCDDGYYVAGDNGSWCSGCIHDSWTAWMDLDYGSNGHWYNNKYYGYSSGIGDFEILSVARKSFPDLKICQNPTNIDVRLDNAGPYYKGGDKVHISVDGFYCLDSEQKYGHCHNYNVRFCCPELQRTTNKDSPGKRLSKLFDSTTSDMSYYDCATPYVRIEWTKSNIGLGYAYKLQVWDREYFNTKETSVQILLTKESYIESASSSPKDCIVTTKFHVSTTKNVIVEVIVERLGNQLRIISKVIHQGGKQDFQMTFVDYIQQT